MNDWKEILKSKKSTYILLGIIAILLILTAYLNFDRMAATLYGKDNPKAKGELLTTYLSIIGGCAVIYGLYLNNKRIKEQTEQNNIARVQADTAKKQADIVANNNNDKRFGDAIGYLASDNTSIVLGGIHILHQLAKEDKRYIPIVINMYCSYLRDKSKSLYSDDKYKEKPSIIIQSIINILFNNQSVFSEEKIDLSDITLINIHFNDRISNCLFQRGVLKNCLFMHGMKYCEFLGTDIIQCHFDGKINNCQFNFLNITETVFGNKSRECTLDDCLFILNEASEIIFGCNNISQVEFNAANTKKCQFRVNTIDYSSFIFINGEDIKFWNAEFIESAIDIDNINSLHFKDCQNTPIINKI